MKEKVAATLTRIGGALRKNGLYIEIISVNENNGLVKLKLTVDGSC